MKLALVSMYVDEGDPPLGLAYIAAHLRERAGFSNTVIVDQNNPLRILGRVRPDLVGISALSCTFPAANRLAGAIRAELGVPVIVGGSHITAMPHHLKDSNFDVGVLGEGEQTAAELVRLYERKRALGIEDLRQIKGIVFRNERNENELTEKRPLIEDLDAIPFPARDLLDMRGRYLAPRKAAFSKIGVYLGITTSRGCPYDCAFCSPRGFWPKFRAYSAERVVDEISLLVKQYKVDGIMIWDDLFAVNKKRLRRIVELLEERSIARKIEFAAFARANLMDEEVVTLLERIGVTSVIFGLESGSERILKYLKQGTVTVAQNYNAIRLCKQHSMRTRATLIIGSPDETHEDLEETARLFKSSDIDEPIVCHLTPLPGTRVWAEAREMGLVRDDFGWDYARLGGWDFDPGLVMSRHLSADELQRFYNELAQVGEARLREDRRASIRLRHLFSWRMLRKGARNWRKYARRFGEALRS